MSPPRGGGKKAKTIDEQTAFKAARALRQGIKRKLNPTNVKNKPNRVPSDNYYSVLSDDDVHDDHENMEAEETAGSATANNDKVRPPPPITVTNASITVLKDKLGNIKNSNELKYKITKNGIRIFSPNTDTFKLVNQFCKDNELQGFTHTPKEEQHVKVCLYGLWSMDTELIKAEISKSDVVPVQVKQLTLKEPRYIDQAIYLVYFQRKQNINIHKLRSITGLFNVVVDWKYYKNKSREPTQCSNCQQLGHGANNCFKPPVCVRCSGFHESKKCPFLPEPKDSDSTMTGTKLKPKIDDALVKCALCSKSGHTASFRDCPERQKYKETQQLINNRQGIPKPARRPQLPNMSSRNEFPRMSTVNRHPLSTSYHIYQEAPSLPTNSNWRPTARTQNLLSPDECMDIFDIFTSELLKCNTIEEQIRTIARLSFEQVSKYLKRNLTSNDYK